MTNSPSAESNPKGNEQSAPEVLTPSGFEAIVRSYWEKYRTAVIAAVIAAFVGIVAKEGWRMYSASRDEGIRTAFAQAGGDAARLTSFANANSGHPLAGVALLRVADEKFASGNFQAAAADYAKAAAALSHDALSGRARLGEAISKFSAGDRAGGETALKAVQSDEKNTGAFRAEAAYHLASIAAEGGRTEEAIKLVDEIGKLDPAGVWSQRALGLRASLDAGAEAAPASETTPSVTFKPGGE